MDTNHNEGTIKGVENEELPKYYRIKDTFTGDLIKIISQKKELPMEFLSEISEQEYLSDRTGKTICYGKSGCVVNKVELKFDWHDENGKPLSNEQIEAFKKAVKDNGLYSFDEDGTIIQVCPPEPNS